MMTSPENIKFVIGLVLIITAIVSLCFLARAWKRGSISKLTISGPLTISEEDNPIVFPALMIRYVLIAVIMLMVGVALLLGL